MVDGKLLMVVGAMVPMIPMFIAYVVLLALAVSRWNRHPRVSMLASSAAVVLMVLDVVTRAFFTLMPVRLREAGESTAQLGMMLSAAGAVSGLIHAVAFGVLIAAVFAERKGTSATPGGFGVPR